MQNSAYMYICTFLLWRTCTISVTKQSNRLRITVNNLPNLAMKIDDSLGNNGISLISVQNVSNPDYVKPNHGAALFVSYLWKNS